jgi:hypothetical protein
MRTPAALCSLVCAGSLTWGVGLAGETQGVTADSSAAMDRMGLLFKPHPLVLTVADLPSSIDSGTVTDVQVADFNGDGRKDIAVAWYATDNEDPPASQRVLSIYLGAGGPSFAPPITFNLYSYDPATPALSIFRRGTSEIGVGDFDGDGDLDLAVLPFFGDELWFIENLGGGAFAPHLAFMFGTNQSLLCTPPAALTADFDGDGRDELVYLVDPVLYPDDLALHFWKTDGAIADMYRLDWDGFGDTLPMQWTRGLTIADFDGDGQPDVCFTRAQNAPQEDGPVFTVWHGLNPATGLFQVWNEFPSVLCSDIAATRPDPNCRPGVVLTDLNGTLVQYWAAECTGDVDFHLGVEVTGYAGLSYNRGMGAVMGDVDGDGDQDLVTKQKLGQASDSNQIEITLCSGAGTVWRRVNPTPIDTTGLQNQQTNQILRPRNLAVADLFGNTLPEIVAGFSLWDSKLKVAVWPNSCLADVNRDGGTGYVDLVALLAAIGTCTGDPAFNPDADFDKNGCITSADLGTMIHDYECACWNGPGHVLADMNCDGDLNLQDVEPFVTALSNRATYEVAFPNCHWMYADINEDGSVDLNDVNPLVQVLTELFGAP